MGIGFALASALMASSLAAQGAPPAPPPAPPQAPSASASPLLQARIDTLVPILDGTGDYDAYFAPVFREAVPKAQFDAVSTQLKAALGRPLRIASVAPTSARSATLTVAFERGTATMDIAIEAEAPHRVAGLLVKATATADDSFARLDADFGRLPGRTAFGVYALDEASPRPIAARNDALALPLGSAFKLWILAEAARQVKAGTRNWRDVVPLGQPSLPSGITQSWPAGAPMTLHSLAALMISISDNTATDTMLNLLGRERVEAMAVAHGADPRSLPILSTREAFALKAAPARALAWAGGDLAARRRILADPAVRQAQIDPAVFNDKPLHADTVEWFASPRAMAGLMKTLADADAETRAILAITPGTDTATAARFGYIGFKGGSEPGVIAASFLLRTKTGRPLAAFAAWNRADADTLRLTFLSLVNRMLALAAGQ